MRSHHLAIKARDVPRVAAFYRDVLQLEVMAAPRDGVAWLRAGELLLMIEPTESENVTSDDGAERPGLHLIAFAIEANERTYWERRLQERGVPIASRTDHTLYIHDPERNRVGLSHYPTPAT